GGPAAASSTRTLRCSSHTESGPGPSSTGSSCAASPSSAPPWKTSPCGCPPRPRRPDMTADLTLAARQVRYEQRAFWRNRPAAFFTFLLPLVFLLVFATLNRD